MIVKAKRGKMKSINLILLLLLGLSFSVTLNAQDSTAAQAYRDQDYKKSIELYEELVLQALNEKKESAQLYYNL
jgi:hypothetical protein